MPPWFIDIESATEIEAKSNGVPPAARMASHACRAHSPSSAWQGVTRPSVEATPTNGLRRSPSLKPIARRKARCGARSRPSTVIREGSFFFILAHDLVDARVASKAEFRGSLRDRGLRHGVHDRLQPVVGREAHLAFRPSLHRIPHLARGYADAGKQHGALHAGIRA